MSFSRSFVVRMTTVLSALSVIVCLASKNPLLERDFAISLVIFKDPLLAMRRSDLIAAHFGLANRVGKQSGVILVYENGCLLGTVRFGASWLNRDERPGQVHEPAVGG